MKKLLTLAAGALIGLSASLPAEAAVTTETVTHYTKGAVVTSPADFVNGGKYFIYAYSKGVGRFIHTASGFMGAKGFAEISVCGTPDASYVYTITVNGNGTFSIANNSGQTFPKNGAGGEGKGNINVGGGGGTAEYTLPDIEVVGNPTGIDKSVLSYVQLANGHYEGGTSTAYFHVNGDAADGSDHHLSYWEKTGDITTNSSTAVAFYQAVAEEHQLPRIEAGHYYFLKNSEMNKYLQLETPGPQGGTMAGVSGEIRTPLIITEGTGEHADMFAIQSATTGKYFASDTGWTSIYNQNEPYYWSVLMEDDGTRFTLGRNDSPNDNLAGPQGEADADLSIWTDNWEGRVQNGKTAHVYWELEEAPTHSVTYNFTQNGVSFSRTATLAEWTNAVAKIPSNFLFLANAGVEQTDKYVKADNTTFTVTGDWNYPVQTNTVYRLALKPSDNAGKVVSVNEAGTEIINNSTPAATMAKTNMWYFKAVGYDNATGNPIYTLHSLKDGANATKGVTFAKNNGGNTSTLTDTPDQLTIFPTTVTTASTDFCLRFMDGTTSHFVNDRSAKFSSWTVSLDGADGDAGCVVSALSLTEDDMSLLNLVATSDTEKNNTTPANIATLIDRYNQNSPELIRAIATADKYPIGTGLGQYINADGDFADKLNEAKALINSTTATEDQINTAIEAIAVSNLHINQPKAGRFYRFCYGNKYLSSTIASNDRFALETETITNGNSNLNNTTVFYLDDDQHLVTYPEGLVMGTMVVDSSLKGFLVTDANAATIRFAESAFEIGKYNITSVNSDETRYLYHRSDNDWVDSGRNAAGNSDAGYRWEIKEVEYLPVPYTGSTAGHFSVCAPVDLDIIQWGHANSYIGVLQGDKVGKKATEGILPANTPAILQANHSPEHGCIYFRISGYPEVAAAAADATNSLTNTGVYAAAKVDGQSYFTVGGDNGDKFVPYNGDTLPAFAAILSIPTAQVSETQATNGYTIADYDPSYTSVSEIEGAGNSGKQVIYDLQGRRVQRASKGLYIINGVKTLVK